MFSFLPEHYLIFNLFFLFIFYILNNLSLKHSYPNINNIVLFGLLFLNTIILLICDLSFNEVFYNNLFIKNNYNTIISITLIFFSLLVVPSLITSNQHNNINHFEFYIVLTISILSLFLVLSSSELISFYFLLEIQSISFYILAAYNKYNKLSIESGIKYFILSTIASLFVLIGFALLYSLSGLMSFIDLHFFFLNCFVHPPLIYLALLCITTSFMFKLYVAPFHFWVADIYQGSPLTSVAIYSILPQLVFYSIYYYILKYIFNLYYLEVSYIFIILTIFTMLLGILFALYQQRIKRVIAFSSIINIGYVLINFYYSNAFILFNSIIFIIVYMINLLTFFSILLNIYDKKKNKHFDNLSDFYGYMETQKELSFLLIINLFSLAGIPFFSLFYSKLLIISSLFTQSSYLLIFFLILVTCITSLVYLRIIKNITYKKSPYWIFSTPLNYINSFIIVQLILFHFYYGFNLDILSTSIYYAILNII